MPRPIAPPTITTADKAAIIVAFQKLENFLISILPIYMQAAPAKKTELRLHNPTLDRFLTMLEKAGASI